MSPVGELHIQCSISLVADHVVHGLPGAFRVGQGEVTPGREGFLTNLIPSPVGNAGCRDGFRASGHNCHRVVVKVVVPVFSADIFPVKSAFYLINLIIDCSSTTVSWSLAMIKARGVLSYENQLPYLKIIFYSN